jgi:hypothetical protein
MLRRLLFWQALTGAVALGCSCTGESQPCVAFGQVEVVFVGTVTKIVSQSMSLQPGRRVTFDVVERFKGADSAILDVDTGLGGGDCGWPFKNGETYLVYAYRSPSSHRLETGICMRTSPINRADEDLAYLRSLVSLGPKGRVFGYVASQRPHRGEKYSGSGAVTGVSVWLRSDSGRQKAVTDSHGEYSFDGIQPGSYTISAEMPRKLGGGEPREISVERQACVYMPFYAVELGSIAGRILDALGKPVVHTWVELLRADDHKFTTVEDGFTDEDGRYQIKGIPAGAYFVGVSLRHSPSATIGLWHPYERNYYPSTENVMTARSLNVASAEAISDVTWRVGAPLGRRTIKGVVIGPDGKPASPVFVELKVEGYDENAALAQTRKDGTFTFDALTKLRYIVQASSGWRQGSEPWHSHAMAIPGDDAPFTIKLDRPGKDCDECRKRR